MNTSFAKQPGSEQDGTTPSGVPAAPRAVPIAPAFDAWRFAHRALRGRYRLACIVGVAGAMVGAGVGMMLAKRLYTSTGLVRIASVLPSVMHETDPRTAPSRCLTDSSRPSRDLMLSPEMIQARTLDSGVWSKPGAPASTPTEEEFAAALKVETRQRSDHLKVMFTGSDPLVASTAVRALVSVFEQAFTRDQERAEHARTSQLTSPAIPAHAARSRPAQGRGPPGRRRPLERRA